MVKRQGTLLDQPPGAPGTRWNVERRALAGQAGRGAAQALFRL